MSKKGGNAFYGLRYARVVVRPGGASAGPSRPRPGRVTSCLWRRLTPWLPALRAAGFVVALGIVVAMAAVVAARDVPAADVRWWLIALALAAALVWWLLLAWRRPCRCAGT